MASDCYKKGEKDYCFYLYHFTHLYDVLYVTTTTTICQLQYRPVILWNYSEKHFSISGIGSNTGVPAVHSEYWKIGKKYNEMNNEWAAVTHIVYLS